MIPPMGVSPKEMLDSMLDCAADMAAQADPRYQAIKAEKKAELSRPMSGASSSARPVKTVTMSVSTSRRKGK